MLKAQYNHEDEKTGGPRVGLALAGGGPLGGIYEIGALLALHEAIEAARSDEVMERAVGKDIFNAHIDRKFKEVMEFRAHVTDWELKRYLPL